MMFVKSLLIHPGLREASSRVSLQPVLYIHEEPTGYWAPFWLC
jgi:hypothetical protein